MRRLFPVLALILALQMPGPGLAQEPATLPTSTTSDQQRLTDFITLIEGPNVPAPARRTGARELLRQRWPETPVRLAALLVGSSTAAKVAVAQALADVPEALAPAYIEPLISMLGDADAEARRAAGIALAGYRDSGVTPRLRALALDASQPAVRRLAAIDTLGLIPKREAVTVLAELLREPDPLLRAPALRAFEQQTAMSFRDDPAAALSWWAQSRDLPLPDWQQAQIERLVQKDRDLARRLRELESRLVEAYRQDYVRAAEPDRPALLQSLLTDTSALVRLLGLELAQSLLGEGKTLQAETATQVRLLLTDSEPEVRVAAVQAVARLRDSSDADRFLTLLEGEQQVRVRRALVNGLGYVGGAGVAGPLLAILGRPDEPCVVEAVAALGRLAERGVLTGATRQATADALLETFDQTDRGQAALRERLLWAMGILADPRFGPRFVLCLGEGEAPTVRQGALRGIAALKDPRLTETLVPSTRDADPSIRRTAIEVFADLASSRTHIDVLWACLDPAQEPDEPTRRVAWRGILRILAGRPVPEIEDFLTRLPPDGTERSGRALDLLQLMERALAATPQSRGELGRVRARIAAERAALGQFDESITAFLAALADLHAAQSPAVQEVGLQLLRVALLNGRYTDAVAAALANGNPPLDGMALWQGLAPHLVPLLTPDKAEHLITALLALRAQPPAVFPANVLAAIDELLQKARAVQSASPSSAPASQPDSPQ